MSSNPFAALFNPSEAISASNIIPEIEQSDLQQNVNQNNNLKLINDAIEDIFGFTICNNREPPFRKSIPLIYLEEYAEDKIQDRFLTMDSLGPALFDRLMIENPDECVLQSSGVIEPTFLETEVLTYLFHCYERLRSYRNIDDVRESMKSFIFQNAVLFLQQPIVFLEQNATDQCLRLIKDLEVSCESFFEDISNFYNNEDGNTFSEVFKQILVEVQKDVVKCKLLTIDRYIYRALQIFTINDKFADVLIEFCTPTDQEQGFNFANTLLGALLSVSILPKTFRHSYEYFENPMDQSNTIIANSLWQGLDNITTELSNIIMRLLKLKEARTKILKWISQCLKANSSRGKLWNQQAFNPAFINTVSDGFMLNLANITLRLCQPFCTNLNDGKILKVDPTYCAVPDEEITNKQINMHGLSSETSLIPSTTDEIRCNAEKYNFVTEIFFITHRTLDLSFRICVDQLVQLNQELSQLQRAYNDAVSQVGGNSPITDSLKARLEDGYKKYGSMRAVLLEPNFLLMMSQFHKATATWLVQICLNNNFIDGYAPLIYRDVVFPFPENVPETLKCIPEFVVENTVGYLSFLRKFYPQTLEEQGYEFLDPILTMVLTFMGSPERMKNPHLRARMAECLEALLPEHKDFPNNMSPMGKFQRETLFKNHPHRMQIVENLLNVFVSIEMTGQSVQFEQKFNYRRPMYIIMDYLWQLEEHKQKFKELAKAAEENMNAVTPPLFLRFVNLLMNDAVFLLDESLSNIAQIRTMQAAQETEWNNLPAEERAQNLSYLNHIGMIARFDNILGRETINTLEELTSEITIVFTHTTMVDRVAAMLNYFLYNLVGPNKKNFKVKDQKEYEFDPANTVLNICRIYVNLYDNDSFCLAISQDGRSYSPQLFSLAEDVLARIGGGVLISQVKDLADKVARLATQQEKEEVILAEAPEEFLDPIMSTLMTDPVILPSSKQIVDRTTIARHILSDQTDPFNREPLTMDQLIPATELKAKIDQWILEKRENSTSSSRIED